MKLYELKLYTKDLPTALYPGADAGDQDLPPLEKDWNPSASTYEQSGPSASKGMEGKCM